MKQLQLVFSALFLLLLAAGSASPQIELGLEQDVYVNSENANTNYAGTVDLYLGNGTLWGLGCWRTYFLIDVTPLAGQHIAYAGLSIFQFQTGPLRERRCDAHRVTEAWDESTITWSNMPLHDPIVLDSQEIQRWPLRWVTWNLTSLVRDWISGAVDNRGVVLKDYLEDAEGNYGLFHATESAQAGRRPLLAVELATTAVEPTTWGALKTIFEP